jgi:hypothetical protein
MMDKIKINLTLKQIIEVLCPDCQEKLLDLASSDGAKDFATKQIKGVLKHDLGLDTPSKGVVG